MTKGEATGTFLVLLFIFTLVVDFTHSRAIVVFVGFFAFAAIVWLLEKIITKL